MAQSEASAKLGVVLIAAILGLASLAIAKPGFFGFENCSCEGVWVNTGGVWSITCEGDCSGYSNRTACSTSLVDPIALDWSCICCVPIVPGEPTDCITPLCDCVALTFSGPFPDCQDTCPNPKICSISAKVAGNAACACKINQQ